MSRLALYALPVVIVWTVPIHMGCGSTAQQHRTLNTLTDIADPTYAHAVETCDAFRDEIIAREGTTYEEDRAAMDRVHNICDRIVAGFELLRTSQLTARAAIDGGLEGAAREAVEHALGAWAELQALLPELFGGNNG